MSIRRHKPSRPAARKAAKLLASFGACRTSWAKAFWLALVDIKFWSRYER